MRRIAIALAAASLLAGCGDGYGGDDSTTGEPRVPGPTDTLVVYERTGGIAGVRERLAVRPDGAARLETGGATLEVVRFRLNGSELEGLRAAREGVDFAKLEGQYGPKQPIADGFATSLTADGRQVTVLTEGKPPRELQRLVDVCAGLVQVHARR
jgi:hypothetical protein